MRRMSHTSRFLSIHCPLQVEETQEQREWTSLGFTSPLLVVECCAGKLDPRLFLEKRRGYRVHCSIKTLPAKPFKLHSLCSWISPPLAMDNGWGDSMLVWLESASPRRHGADGVAPLVDSQVNCNPIQIKSQVNPRVILEFRINS